MSAARKQNSFGKLKEIIDCLCLYWHWSVVVQFELEPEMNGQGLVYQSKPLESNARISR
jgi:hypothetical protein